MARQKRFYWFRFMSDFYHRREVRRLKTPLNREIYLRMCVSVIKTDDFKIHFHDEDETLFDEIYFDCEIDQTGGTVEDVKNVIKMCLKSGLIKTDNPNKYLYFPDMQELTGSETAKAQYMRDKREREKNEVTQNGNNVTQNSNNVPKDGNNVHIDREEKSKSKRRADREKEQNQSSANCEAIYTTAEKDKGGVASNTVNPVGLLAGHGSNVQDKTSNNTSDNKKAPQVEKPTREAVENYRASYRAGKKLTAEAFLQTYDPAKDGEWRKAFSRKVSDLIAEQFNQRHHSQGKKPK